MVVLYIVGTEDELASDFEGKCFTLFFLLLLKVLHYNDRQIIQMIAAYAQPIVLHVVEVDG
jgi:hypothetical protein